MDQAVGRLPEVHRAWLPAERDDARQRHGCEQPLRRRGVRLRPAVGRAGRDAARHPRDGRGLAPDAVDRRARAAGDGQARAPGRRVGLRACGDGRVDRLALPAVQPRGGLAGRRGWHARPRRRTQDGRERVRAGVGDAALDDVRQEPAAGARLRAVPQVHGLGDRRDAALGVAQHRDRLGRRLRRLRAEPARGPQRLPQHRPRRRRHRRGGRRQHAAALPLQPAGAGVGS